MIRPKSETSAGYFRKGCYTFQITDNDGIVQRAQHTLQVGPGFFILGQGQDRGDHAAQDARPETGDLGLGCFLVETPVGILF